MAVRGGAARPLLVFPEGSLTNGRIGLMRFAQTAFSLGVPVTPVAIRLRTPLPLEADTIWSPLAANVLWTLFQPWHSFDLRVLDEVETEAEEVGAESEAKAPGKAGLEPRDPGPARAARRVARSLAAELGLAATEWTTKDKAARSTEAKLAGKAAWLRQLKQLNADG